MSRTIDRTAPASRLPAPRRTARLIAAGLEALRRWHQSRIAVGRLGALDDRMLKDIGLDRSGIERAAWHGRPE